MYRCEKCEEKFIFPRAEREFHFECGEIPFESYLVCPFCGNGEITDIILVQGEVFYEKM